MRPRQGFRIGAAAAGLAVGVQMFGSLALGPGADAHSGVVQATTRVHVRTQPTTSSTSLTVLNPGQSVTASGTTDGWTKITWNGRTAYVFSKYLTGSDSNGGVVGGDTKGIATTTANLNIRTGAGTSHRSVTVVRKGTKLELTGRTSGDWKQVIWRGTARWAHGRYLTTTSSGGGTTTPTPKTKVSMQTTANLNIRTGASTSYSRVATAPRGSILQATGTTRNGFHQVVWQGNLRWASSQYLRQVPSDTSSPTPGSGDLPKTTTRWATTALNIWHASTGSSYNGEFPKGSALAVTGVILNGRAQIVHNGAIRWVTARYTTTTDPKAKPDPIAPISGSWDLTSPPITGGPRGADLNKGYSSGMERTNPYIQRISADAWQRFPEIKTHYGWRRDVTPDHPAGRAVDLMIPNYRSNKELGWAVAEYYKKYAKELNISYIIWDQKIWSVARSREGWRNMANRGSDSANHLDHVHVNSN